MKGSYTKINIRVLSGLEFKIVPETGGCKVIYYNTAKGKKKLSSTQLKEKKIV